MDDPRGDVELIASHRQAYDRDAGGKCLDRRPVAAVGDDRGCLAQHLDMRCEAHNLHVGGCGQDRRIDASARSYDSADLDVAQRSDDAAQQVLLVLKV